MTTITTGASTITPSIVTTYEARRAAQTIVHVILGSPEPDVSLRPALRRSGRIELGFAGPTCEADSNAAAGVLAGASVFTLTDPDRATHNMTFVVTGDIPRALEDTTRNAYTVAFEFQEVSV